MKTIATLVLCFSLASFAQADEARNQRIGRILEAQGLKQMFEAQLSQSRASAVKQGQEIYDQMISQLGTPNPEANQKLRAAFERYMERCASMWSAQELVDTWAAQYGRGLSDEDLGSILTYYTSAVGRKDVTASQQAMVAFSQVMADEGQKRMMSSVNSLIADLKSAAAR